MRRSRVGHRTLAWPEQGCTRLDHGKCIRLVQSVEPTESHERMRCTTRRSTRHLRHCLVKSSHALRSYRYTNVQPPGRTSGTQPGGARERTPEKPKLGRKSYSTRRTGGYFCVFSGIQRLFHEPMVKVQPVVRWTDFRNKQTQNKGTWSCTACGFVWLCPLLHAPWATLSTTNV